VLAPERFASRRDTMAFVVCLALSLVARVLPQGVQDVTAAAIRSTILSPFLELQQQMQLLKTSRAELAHVSAQRDSAVQAAMDVVALREENARLRELLDLGRRITQRHVAAEVLHQSEPTDGLTMLLTAGSDQGVKALDPVLTPSGLLGVIRSVTASRSVALLWTHPDFRVSVMTPDGSVFGIVAPHGATGPNTMMMELTGVPYREIVPPGTPLYTSGFGGVYPRGIPIGWVTAVAEERAGWARTYVVRPAVHPASVRHVMILLDVPSDLSAAYPRRDSTP